MNKFNMKKFSQNELDNIKQRFIFLSMKKSLKESIPQISIRDIYKYSKRENILEINTDIEEKIQLFPAGIKAYISMLNGKLQGEEDKMKRLEIENEIKIWQVDWKELI